MKKRAYIGEYLCSPQMAYFPVFFFSTLLVHKQASSKSHGSNNTDSLSP